MRTPLRVAAAQPPCIAGDVSANALAHADAVHRAEARVVVFPELSITGYELDAEVVSADDDALAPLLHACAATGSLALVGAPVRDDAGLEHIAMLAVTPVGVEVAYRKTWLSGAEAVRFAAGDGPTVLDVNGWRLGVGICKDTGVPEHVAGIAALGIDVYVAGLVHSPDELPIQDARGFRIAQQCQAHVVFASFAGAAGSGYPRTAGASTIWSPQGHVLSRAGADTGDIACASIG